MYNFFLNATLSGQPRDSHTKLECFSNGRLQYADGYGHQLLGVCFVLQLALFLQKESPFFAHNVPIR